MSDNTELSVYDDGSGVTLWRKPEQVLAEAKEAATALISVISQKPKKVMFNGEQYIEREDWGTVAKFYGCTAKIVETKFVNYDGVRGFEATAVCLDRNLNEISRAESLCLSDEENWGMVAKYEWQDELDENGKKIWVEGPNGKKRPKANKVKVGEVAKPLFQLKSMAQTRAEAKVLKSVFGYVVVLAGYRPTVAEEMTGNEGPDEREEKRPVQQPQRASDKAKQAEPPAQGQQGQETAVEVISGTIDSVKMGTKEKPSVWLKVSGHFIVAEEGKTHEEMVEGNYISVKARKFNSDKIGPYYKVVEVLECSSVQEGQVEEGGATPAVAEGATAETFDKPADKLPEEGSSVNPENPLKDLFATGAVTTASQIKPVEPTKEGTIGLKRAQRLHVLITQNHKKTGFTEEVLKAMMEQVTLEHLRELPVQMYPTFEAYALGEMDWRTGK